MLTRSLMYALDKAQRPYAVRAVVRGLELVTGQSTSRMLGKSIDLGGFSTTDDLTWYTQNGFNGIAAALGGGYKSITGRTMGADAVMESSAVYGCVRIIAEDLGSLELLLKRWTADRRSNAPDFAHPLFPILHDMPNPDMNAGAVIESLMVGAMLCRDGYARIDRDSAGRIMYLWPLAPGSVTRSKNQFGRPFFIYKDGNSQEITYDQSRIFNLPGFSVDGSRGDDILRRARNIFGLTLAPQEYAARFFANDASPGVVISRPAGTGAPWDDTIIAAIKQKWRDWHQGLNRAHEPAILQDGATITRIDPDHGKLQLVEQRKFQVIECCRVFRMKPHKLADLDRATFGNIEHQSIEYVRDTLMPWTTRWSQSIYRCLLTPKERAAGYFAQHSIEDAMRGDFLSQAQAYGMLQEKGDMTQNEVRARLHLPPADGGDRLWIQLNMQAVADAATGVVADQGSKLLAAGEVKPYVNGKALPLQ